MGYFDELNKEKVKEENLEEKEKLNEDIQMYIAKCIYKLLDSQDNKYKKAVVDEKRNEYVFVDILGKPICTISLYPGFERIKYYAKELEPVINEVFKKYMIQVNVKRNGIFLNVEKSTLLDIQKIVRIYTGEDFLFLDAIRNKEIKGSDLSFTLGENLRISVSYDTGKWSEYNYEIKEIEVSDISLYYNNKRIAWFYCYSKEWHFDDLFFCTKHEKLLDCIEKISNDWKEYKYTQCPCGRDNFYFKYNKWGSGYVGCECKNCKDKYNLTRDKNNNFYFVRNDIEVPPSICRWLYENRVYKPLYSVKYDEENTERYPLVERLTNEELQIAIEDFTKAKFSTKLETEIGKKALQILKENRYPYACEKAVARLKENQEVDRSTYKYGTAEERKTEVSSLLKKYEKEYGYYKASKIPVGTIYNLDGTEYTVEEKEYHCWHSTSYLTRNGYDDLFFVNLDDYEEEENIHPFFWFVQNKNRNHKILS